MPHFSSHVFGRSLAVLALVFGSLLPAVAQVGIGTTAPHAKAALEVKSTTKGLLPPRMTQPERDAIAPGADAAGLTVYNTTTGKLNTWNGVTWTETLLNEPPRTIVVGTYTTPGTYSYVVPAGTSRLIVDARGAEGGSSSVTQGYAAPGGAGGRLKASIAVTAGETLTINVGGAGVSTTGGFNGGGNGGNGGSTFGGGGGGASDVRRGSALTDRLLTAAGGGGGAGAGSGAAGLTGVGGAGGYPTGGSGLNSTSSVAGGRGGTQTGPGPSSASPGAAYSPGSLGQGGASHSYFSGGGGGGYYGGNGGGVSVVIQGNTYFGDGAGGGGSSWITPTDATLVLTETATGGGDGSVTLTPVPDYAAPALDASNFINVAGDNLGNHIATTNVGLNGNWLSNAPGNTNGIRIDNSGDVTLSGRLGLGTSGTPTEKLQIVNGSIQLTATSPVGVGISNATSSLNLALANGNGQYSDVAQTGDAVLRSNGKRLILAGREGGEVIMTTGTAGAEVERLRITTAGLMRVSGFAGGGTQIVTTDNSGNLSAAPVSSIADNLGNHEATRILALNDNPLLLRSSSDFYHGLRYSSGSDGPQLYGSAGGQLGVWNGTNVQAVLHWTRDGNVGIGTTTPGAGLHVRTPEKAAVSDASGVYLSGGATGNPNIELRSANGAPYLDFANDLPSDFSARIQSSSSGLGFHAGGSVTPQLLVGPGSGVGVGGAAPASAALAVTSTTQGFLPPRMTATERNNIGSPAAGLIIYNTTTNQINTWNGTEWEATSTVTQGIPLGTALATFAYTGAVQTYTIPAGVTSVVVTANGAVGGTLVIGNNVYPGGKGAQAQTVLTVTPGETLNVYVGGTGGFNTGNGAGPGGWNGGGNARGGGGGGGGATDLRRGGTALTNRLVVAAGGGGSAYITGNIGGDGGAPNGSNGVGSTPGGGATQQSGGQPVGYSAAPVVGSLGLGGDSDFFSGGAGGGGLYGGSGARGSGGGGGSSWVTPTGTADTRLIAGVSSGNGSLTISLPQDYPAPTLDGANISGAWDVSGTNYYYNGGNVGIGTSSPGQKLDVVGTARVQGTLQVGTNGMPGGIEVLGASGATTTTLDQQQLIRNGSATVVDNWQSFTAGITGTLVQLDPSVGPSVGNPAAAGQLSIYAGEGISGALLSSQAVTYQQVGNAGFQQFVLTTPVPVTAGQQYTFRLTAAAGSNIWWDGGGNNPYAGGRFWSDPFTDWAFKSYVATPNGARLLTVLPTGQMGLGTATPSEKLDVVNGNVKISTTGNGLIFPDGTTQTTAALTSNFIQNTTTTQTGASFNVGGSGTVGGLLTAGTSSVTGNSTVGGNSTVSGTQTISSNAYVNGSLGVVLNGQDRPLITRGYDVFSSGNYNGAGRWGLFMESEALTFGVPAIANKRFQWATYNAASTVNTTLMTLLQNGNLGLGTPTPNYKLEVNGTALINSTYDLLLRDANHGLGWYGGGKLWGTANPDGPVLYGFTGGMLGTKDGGSRAILSWNKDNQVGIGTTTLVNGLSVSTAEKAGTPSVGGVFLSGGASGNANIEVRGGGTPYLDFAVNTSVDYTSRIIENGGLRFSVGASSNTAMIIQANTDRVGIGTTSPIAPLHVKGAASNAVASGNASFFNQGSGFNAISNMSGSKPTTAYFEGGEVWVSGFIVAGNLNTTSDRRIKNIVGLSDRATDLALLNRLRITDYTYIDQVNNTPGVIKKVIAQEVETVLPTAVSRSFQALPNVYERATRVSFANGLVTVTTAKPHELPATGGRMRLYTPANAELNPDVTVIDAHTIRFTSTEAYAEGLFVYGKFVDDFRSVDYDALTTLNVSATQELARKVAALEAENAALKAGAAADKSQTTATLESLADRLRALEVGSGQARK